MSFQKTGVPFSPTAQIFNGRKTDQCGVVVFGSEGSQSPLSRALITLTHSCGIETNNVVHDKNGGYEHVSEYIPIAQPNATTLAKLDALKPSESSGDRAYTLLFHILFRTSFSPAIDALIVGIETQDIYLEKKRTWTRKIVIVTDGESPIEIEDWEATVKKMNVLSISLTVMYALGGFPIHVTDSYIISGIDFDDDEFPFHEEDKSTIKVNSLQSILYTSLFFFQGRKRSILS